MHKRLLFSFPFFPVLMCVVLFVLLRIPSLIEPYWYGDEGIYAVIGQALQEGKLLYKDIWDNKPPVLYLLYASVNGNLFWIKTLSLIVGVLTVLVYYLLSKKLFKSDRVSVISTGIFSVLFGLPILEGNIANAENFMILPITLSALLLFFYSSARWSFMAGVLLSIALMTKIVAIFEISAFLYVSFLQTRLQTPSIRSTAIRFIKKKNIYYLLAGIVLFPLTIITFYFFNDSISDLLSSTFTNNVGYVGYHNYLLFPLGLVVLKISLLVLSLVGIYLLRKKLSSSEVIILPWMVFALFSMFFSDRPYTHYVLMGIVPFSLLIGLLVERFRLRTFLILVLVVTAVRIHFPLYIKTTPYYQNFVEYVFGDKSFRDYVNFFDRNALRDYDVASQVKKLLEPGDTVYFWSDSAQLYLLTDTEPFTKYIVAYHAIMYEDAMETVLQQVSSHDPRYIVITAHAIPQDLLKEYTLKYTNPRSKIYEKNN